MWGKEHLNSVYQKLIEAHPYPLALQVIMSSRTSEVIFTSLSQLEKHFFIQKLLIIRKANNNEEVRKVLDEQLIQS